jgi:uncharacterized protein
MQTVSLAQWQEQFKTYLQQHSTTEDAAHAMGHFERVWKTCRYLNSQEGNRADELVLLTASYFHDLIALPKNHPDRSQSSRLSADQTALLLREHFSGFPAGKIEAVQHAIHAHSFSAGIAPQTLEAQILQDADRMEALGAIGIARTFYTAGFLKTQLFHEADPLGEYRELDDRTYALDHFRVKLLQLPALMNTTAGKQLAAARAATLLRFMEEIKQEIEGAFE